MKNRLLMAAGVITAIVGFGSSLAFAGAEGQSADRKDADFSIVNRINADFDRDTRIDLKQVEVTSHEGTVLLKGTVLTEYERAHAAQLAGDVPGVKEVVNKINVVEPLNADFSLAKTIRGNILRNPALNVSKLDVKVKDRHVVLMGFVGDPNQKQTTGRIVRDIEGVHSLTNKIRVLDNK